MAHFTESGEIISEDGGWRWNGDHRKWERIGAPPTEKPGFVTRLFVREEAWGRPRFRETQQAASMSSNRKELLVTARANTVLADDIITKDEEQDLLRFAESLGADLNDYPEVFNRFVIANANAGRFPNAAPPLHIIPKPGEDVYMESQAGLMKEVADRQWEGGSSGYSFRIAKGVRYRVGNTRGHMVEVGTKLVEKDDGFLSVTSTRLVFSGRTTTQESLYTKIENLTVFKDGVSVAVRRGSDITTRLYSTGRAEMIVAIINAAMQPHAPVEGDAVANQDAALPAPPGLMSPDGKWRWDGTAWQPAQDEGDQKLTPPPE
jgi:hypothetical protein